MSSTVLWLQLDDHLSHKMYAACELSLFVLSFKCTVRHKYGGLFACISQGSVNQACQGLIYYLLPFHVKF